MTRGRSRAQPPYLRERVRALRRRLSGAGADAVLITNPCDIRYLTGFVGDDSWALIRARTSEVYVLSDRRFEEQIRKEAPHVRGLIRKSGLGDELLKLKKKLGAGQIAVQAQYLTLSQQATLAKKVGARALKVFDDGLLKQRAIKDSREITATRKAVRIAQQAYQRTLSFAKPGMSESHVAAYIEYQMRLLGADKAAFDTIVAVDANASLPHAIPGSRKLRSNGLLLVDWGARYRGYCCDLTRTVAIGKMPAQLRQVYAIVLEAQLAAIDAIAPGKRLKDIDAVARGVIKKAGYGDCFGHGLGHGLGLDIHEQPVLSFRSEGELEPGHLVTVEPGIYLPGVGGVRIEDDVLVTRRGRRVLSDLPKTLRSAIM